MIVGFVRDIVAAHYLGGRNVEGSTITKNTLHRKAMRDFIIAELNSLPEHVPDIRTLGRIHSPALSPAAKAMRSLGVKYWIENPLADHWLMRFPLETTQKAWSPLEHLKTGYPSVYVAIQQFIEAGRRYQMILSKFSGTTRILLANKRRFPIRGKDAEALARGIIDNIAMTPDFGVALETENLEPTYGVHLEAARGSLRIVGLGRKIDMMRTGEDAAEWMAKMERRRLRVIASEPPVNFLGVKNEAQRALSNLKLQGRALESILVLQGRCSLEDSLSVEAYLSANPQIFLQ